MHAKLCLTLPSRSGPRRYSYFGFADSFKDFVYSNKFHTNVEVRASLGDMFSSSLYARDSQAMLPFKSVEVEPKESWEQVCS